jgi:glycosyltransferase involved in cell wall biosynthesis
MKILFITPSYKPAYIYGGPTVSVSELAESLVAIGHSVTVYTTTANGRQELPVHINKPSIVNGVDVFYFPRITGDHTHVSPSLWKKILKTHREFEVIHLQSWWSILIIGAASILKLKKRKYFISPRGMLGAYSFSNQHNLIKKLIHKTIGKRLLKASILHATTLLEWNDCMLVNNKWKGFISHNLINLPPLVTERSKHDKKKILTLGFLSRIDPKKGLENLFNALANVSFPYALYVAGNGDTLYLNRLKSLTTELGISDRIKWIGWVSGNDKFIFLEDIDLFVLPSFNENFAIAVTESLAVGTPVLVSTQVGLAEYVSENKVGFVCQPTADSILKLLEYINQNLVELERIRKIAPKKIVEDFNKERLAQEYVKNYYLFLK